MTEHKHAAVLRAIADGKEVEYFDKEDGIWREMSFITLLTYPEFEWRIKPEPKPPIMVDDCVQLEDSYVVVFGVGPANIRFTFDPDTKLPIKVELI